MGKIASFKLYGDIGEKTNMDIFSSGEGVFSAKDISDFLDENKEAEEITIKINSRGGDVQEGWAIHDLLINSGKKIKTIGEGKIYSIATIVFLAGEKREIMKNADGLIHNPFIPPYTLADQYESGDLLKIAEGLAQEEEKILDFYVERTGAPREKLAEYMKEDTKLSAEDMLSLGFATKIIEPVKAYAYIKSIHKMDPKEVKTFSEKLDALAAKVEKVLGLSRIAPADITLKDKDGKECKLEKESGDPAVGDKASPDGTYVMTSGKTIVVTDGVIKEITQEKTELDQAREKIAQLETENAALKAEKPDLVKADADMKQATADAQALVTELTALKNTWRPEGRTKFNTADKVGSINLAQVREIMKNKKSE